MSDTRERSGIFKFFYIVLSVITFPIFVVIYIFKHPFWVLFFVLLISGGIVFYPLSKGVEIDKVVEWYKTQYMDKKLEIVTKAVESGKGGLVPSSIIEEVEKTKKKLEDEKKESLREKSENYNDKVVRDEKFEEVALGVKKKGGFKKKTKPMNSKENVETAIGEGVKAGGLGMLFKKVEEEKKLLELVDENEGAENPSDVSMEELDALIGDIESNSLYKKDVSIEDKSADDAKEEVKEIEVLDVESEIKEEIVEEVKEIEVPIADEVKEKVDDVVGAVDALVKEVKNEVVNIVDVIEPVEDIDVEIKEKVEGGIDEVKEEPKIGLEEVLKKENKVEDVVDEIEEDVKNVLEEISVEDVNIDIF